MFLWATGATVLALGATIAASLTAERHIATRRRPLPTWWLLRRYHPGRLLGVAVAMGLGINIPFYFLRPFTQEMGIRRMHTFFVIYAAVAFLVRWLCRRFPDRWGTRPTVLLGMGFLAVHLMAFLLVRNERQLAIPAMLGGIAHALVFPAATTGACRSFPVRHRGLATAWILTMFDLGNLVGQPAVGTILHVARQYGWPPYPTMFVLAAVSIAMVTLYYALRPEGRTLKAPGSGLQVAGPRRQSSGARSEAVGVRTPTSAARSQVPDLKTQV
jgi:MFS family permease